MIKAIGLGIFLICLAVTSSAVPLMRIKVRAFAPLCQTQADCEDLGYMCIRSLRQDYGHCIAQDTQAVTREAVTTPKPTPGVTEQPTKAERQKTEVTSQSDPASDLETDVDDVRKSVKTCRSSADCEAIGQVCNTSRNPPYGHCIAKENVTTTPTPTPGLAEQLENLGPGKIHGKTPAAQYQTKRLQKRMQRNSDWIRNIRSQPQPRTVSTRYPSKHYQKRSLNLDIDLDTELDKSLTNLEIHRLSDSVKAKVPIPGIYRGSPKGNRGVQVKGNVEVHVTHHIIHTTVDNRTIGNTSSTSRLIHLHNLQGLETNWRRIMSGGHGFLNASLPKEKLGLHQMGTLLTSVAKAIKYDVNRDPFKYSGDIHKSRKNDKKEEEDEEEEEDEDEEEEDEDEDEEDEDEEDEEEEDDEGEEGEEEEEEEDKDKDKSKDVKRKVKRSYDNNNKALHKNEKGAKVGKQKRSFGIVQEAVDAVFSTQYYKYDSDKPNRDSKKMSDRGRRNIGSVKELAPVPHKGKIVPQLDAVFHTPTDVSSYHKQSQGIPASSRWSECSVTCGLGSRRRKKVCADMTCAPGQTEIKPCMMPTC